MRFLIFLRNLLNEKKEMTFAKNYLLNCVEGQGLLSHYLFDPLFTAETDIKYEGYVKIENSRVKKLKKMENIAIPNLFDYSLLPNLSSESKEKLARVRPETLGQASRIAGVRPTDIGVLALFLKSFP